MSLFAPTPPPKSPLARYRILSPLCSLRVSPIQLGGMNIGAKSKDYGLGAMDKESSFKLLDKYFELGGNFIDTANQYQDETSEMYIGEWMEKRGNRDQMVIATKYSNQYTSHLPEIPIKANYSGNNIKNMNVSVGWSLKKLRTTHIDILYVHYWDFTAGIEEVMNGLHNLVVSGKVLYLGISDTPAWVVAQANQYARDHGKTPFVIYQGAWNVMARSFERDIIPMARSLGLALAPWDVLSGGKLRTDAEEELRRSTGEHGRKLLGPNWERNENEKKMSAALEKVAGEVGTKQITAVAIAYLLHKTPYVFPIVGGRKVEQLEANLDALRISLTPEHMKYLESVLPFDPGFPNWMIGDGTSHGFLTLVGTFVEPVPRALPITPAKDANAN